MAIKKCNCESAFQDKKYGKGMRVHNKYIKEGGGYRCTVCGSQKQ